jgi:MarR family 2-MHQ and catechol resistance regulon transcriptional repressor
MNLLHNNSEGLSQSDLSRQLVVHRSNITGLVDRLEKRNLVKRTAVPGDRRLYNVALTPQGSTIMEEILPLYHESAVRLWEGVTDDRIQALLSDLESVIQQSQTIARELSESSATAQRKGK